MDGTQDMAKLHNDVNSSNTSQQNFVKASVDELIRIAFPEALKALTAVANVYRSSRVKDEAVPEQVHLPISSGEACISWCYGNK